MPLTLDYLDTWGEMLPFTLLFVPIDTDIHPKKGSIRLFLIPFHLLMGTLSYEMIKT